MNPESASASGRRNSRLKLAGTVVLVLGLLGSSLVYWLGSRPPEPADDVSLLQYNRPRDQQMEMLYGKQGRLIQELTDAAEKPGTQALALAAVSIVVAAFCFYLARPAPPESQTGRNLDA